MSAILGTDSFRYQVVDDWAKLPDGWALNADVAAVGVDKNDNVYCFNRGEHPMIVFDRNGKVLLIFGIPSKPAPYMSGEPFHRCTHTALSPKQEIYISDGYGNSRVHK